MTFRRRLTLFFLFLVGVPVIAIAVVAFRVVSDSETGKADARVAQVQSAAAGLFEEARGRAAGAAKQIGGDRRLARALRTGNLTVARRRARTLLRATGAKRIVLATNDGATITAGSADAFGPVRRRVVGRHGRGLARIDVSTLTAGAFAARIERLTRFGIVVTRGSRVLGSTVPGARPAALPDRGDATIGKRTFRTGSFSGPDFGGRPFRVVVLSDAGGLTSKINNSRLVLGLFLLVFLAAAVGFALVVSRALQAQVASFLEAARRLGRGDFTTPVPTEGGDEFAELGEEFNRMSGELELRLDELRRERGRLETAILRVGEGIASSLDRDALLEVVVRSAVDGVAASCGRGSTRSTAAGDLVEHARAGDIDGLEPALAAAEERALASAAPSEATIADAGALAYPLLQSERPDEVRGIVSVARAGEPFTERERNLFQTLAAQAALSVENVELHEQVKRQAVTDELTGLSNHRRFQAVIDSEIERARRFDQDMALVLLDIDNFKSVNDTYGHPKGDDVLREVARVLKESSRNIDEPARYGGEEMAVALPQTDLEGAVRLAERMRTAIEGLAIPLANGDGPLKVTASIGVASLPKTAGDKHSLIAAADAALYEAKRTGKNKTVRAQ
jgi:diguanylate cyclase (GGDEF)-like protein